MKNKDGVLGKILGKFKKSDIVNEFLDEDDNSYMTNKVLGKVNDSDIVKGTFIIPEGVTCIGENAFFDCTSLKKVVMHEGVEEIGWGAFNGCTSLQEIDLTKCTRISHYAFSNCKSLKKVTLSKNLISLADTAFNKCSDLELYIPTSLFCVDVYAEGKVDSNFGAKKVNIYDAYDVYCYMTTDGSGYAKVDIQARELMDKIVNVLKENNIRDNKCFEYDEHRQFIQKIYQNICKRSALYSIWSYDYREDFNKYINNYIKKYQFKLEPEIIGFDDENHITDKIELVPTPNSNANNQYHNVDNINIHVAEKEGGIEDYTPNNLTNENVSNENNRINLSNRKMPVINDIDDLDGYANKLGLSSEIVAKLKNMINIYLLKSNINDKKYFYDMSHTAFIREVLESMVQDRNYDYNTAVYHYMTNYIDTHKSKNESMILENTTINSNSNNRMANESIDRNIINENNELRRKVEELEKELLNYKQSQGNQSKVSLAKEPLVISDGENELNSNARRR